MEALGLSPLRRFADAAPVVLRVAVGVVMLAHGWQKLTEMGPGMLAGEMLTGMVPLPLATAWFLTIAELVGGALLVVGLFTRLATIPLIVILAGAIVLVKAQMGLIAPMGAPMPGAELDVALLAGLVGVLLLGPGALSLDRVLRVESGTVAVVDDRGRTQPAAAR